MRTIKFIGCLERDVITTHHEFYNVLKWIVHDSLTYELEVDLVEHEVNTVSSIHLVVRAVIGMWFDKWSIQTLCKYFEGTSNFDVPTLLEFWLYALI